MRHGEKLYETLVSAEELRRAEDLGDYYRIRIDDRDLNYSKYFTDGDLEEVGIEDYHSHNARQLDGAELERMLLALPEVVSELDNAVA